jgi:hypothetical protein
VPPRSWLASFARKGDEERERVERELRRRQDRRIREFLCIRRDEDEEVEGDDGVGERMVESLVDICAKVILRDLARDDDGIYHEWIRFMPKLVRERLVEIAPTGEGTSLTARGIGALLSDFDDEGVRVGYDPLLSLNGDQEVADDWDEGVVGIPHSPTLSIRTTLTSLDLTSSDLSLASLHELLLFPIASASATSHPRFPNLSTLNLSRTSLRFTTQFFTLLAALLPLRRLSLAGKTIPRMYARGFLGALEASTRGLRELDLSYIVLPTSYDSTPHAPLHHSLPSSTSSVSMIATTDEREAGRKKMIGSIQWNTHWPDLIKLGWRDDSTDSLRMGKKERKERGWEVRNCMTRPARRKWIDIVV